MLSKLKAKWRELKSFPIGKRFQTVHERQKGAPAWVKPLVITGAVAAFAIGVVLSIMPGPAFVFYGLAAGLAAMQSAWIARGLDRTEVVLRMWRKKLKARWARFKNRPRRRSRARSRSRDRLSHQSPR